MPYEQLGWYERNNSKAWHFGTDRQK